MRYNTIIFDLDGTLLNTSEGILACFDKTVEGLRLEAIDQDWRKKAVGPNLYYTFANYFGLNEEKTAEAVAYFRREYAEWAIDLCKPYEGIMELLEGLKRRGVTLAIATSKLETAAKIVVERNGFAPYISVVSGPSPSDTSEDKSWLIRRVMEKTQGPYLMVGDRRYDIEGAKSVGIDSAYALYGFGSEEEAKQCGADFIAGNADEIWALIEGPGRFLTFEGGDGAGKTTQMSLVKQYLEEKGYRVYLTREPGGNAAAERIREVILDPNLQMDAVTEAYLYAASRAEHVRQVIRPRLQMGQIVLCDRYLDSSIAYQGYGRGLGEEMVEAINKPAVDGVYPDRSYLFTLERDEQKRRMEERPEKDRLELEGETFRDRVRIGYEAVYKKAAGRVQKIDAGRSIEEVFAQICRDLGRIL